MSPSQIIQSSVESYAAGGFEYQQTNDLNIDDILTTQSGPLLVVRSFSRKGVYTLPICRFSSSDMSLKEFFSWLAGPGQTFEPPSIRPGGSNPGVYPG
jgi:hypothetical protein